MSLEARFMQAVEKCFQASTRLPKKIGKWGKCRAVMHVCFAKP
jgi:hypothetical protein